MNQSKKNNILILGSFEDKGALEHRYTRGFIKQNWTVQPYEIEFPVRHSVQKNLLTKALYRIWPDVFLKEINKKVIRDVKAIKPAVILVFKGMPLFPDTIKELKKHTLLLCNYNPDHPLEIYSRGGTNQHVIDSVPHYDVLFTYTDNITKKIRDTYNIAAYSIPFGYDAALNEKYAGAYNQKLADSFLFVGAWDKTRESNLTALGRHDVDIYGDREWGSRTAATQLVHQLYKQKKLYEDELYNTIRSSLGVINILREQNIVEASHNMRTFEVPGYGGLLLSQYTDEQASFFEPGKEAIYYHSLDELNAKMDELKNNTIKVRHIKSNALARSMKSGYSYDDRSKQMLDIIQKHLN